MKQVLQNLSTRDCQRTPDGAPMPGSYFYVAFNTHNPKLGVDFMEATWSVLRAAVDGFCKNDILTPQEESTLLACLEYTRGLSSNETSVFPPSELDSLLMDYEDPDFAPEPCLPYDGVDLFSAYAILCIDKAISAALADNAADVGKFSMYAGAAITLIPNYYEAPQSDVARKAALERHKKDPKQIDKKLVKECWLKWQENPGSYPSKAAFAKDMLEKCEHLQSQKKIEDWCRIWAMEAAVAAAAGKARKYKLA